MELNSYLNFKKIINPQVLDICLEEENYLLFEGLDSVKSPLGKPLASKKYRIMQFVLFELSRTKQASASSINGYSLLSYQTDYIDDNNDIIEKEFDNLLLQDHFFKPDLNFRINMDLDVTVLDIIDTDQLSLNYLLGGLISINKNLKRLLEKSKISIESELNEQKNNEETSNRISDFSPSELIKKIYLGLSEPQKAAISLSCYLHNAGLILPLLLVKNCISPSEYGMSLYCIDLLDYKRKISEEEIKVKDYASKIDKYYFEAHLLKEYISYYSRLEDVNEELLKIINTGESYNTEFKSTLRVNLKTGKKDSIIEHACLKTIDAFFNSGGGNLLIGVRDDGSIEGIESDQFINSDKFLMHFWNLIKESFDIDITPLIRCEITEISKKSVCHVKCFRSEKPVFLKQKGFEDEYFIRVGPSSIKLGISEAFKYIKKHFAEEIV